MKKIHKVRIDIVGHMGSGKSTLAQILSRELRSNGIAHIVKDPSPTTNKYLGSRIEDLGHVDIVINVIDTTGTGQRV